MQMQFENIFNIDFLEFFFSLYQVSKYYLESLYVPSIRICYTSFNFFILVIAKSYISKANKCCLYLNLIYIILMQILPRICKYNQGYVTLLLATPLYLKEEVDCYVSSMQQPGFHSKAHYVVTWIT